MYAIQFCLWCFLENETNKENVFGAGDVTEFPLFLVDDAATNIQHWQMAQQQGYFQQYCSFQQSIYILPFINSVNELNLELNLCYLQNYYI